MMAPLAAWLFGGDDADEAGDLEARVERYDEQIRALEQRLDAGPPEALRDARRQVARYVAAGEDPPRDLLEERDRLAALHAPETLEAALEELRDERAEIDRQLAQKRKAQGEKAAPEAADAVVARGRELVRALLQVHREEWAAYARARDRYAAACRKAREAAHRLRSEHGEGEGRAELPGNLDTRLRQEAPSVKAAEALMAQIKVPE